MLFFVVVVVIFFFYFFPPNRSIAGWFYYCCIALHFFVAVKKYRGGIGEFQAPFGVAYEGVYYATKEEADEAWGSHGAKKRLELKGESPTANGVVEKNASGESSENETEKKFRRLHRWYVSCQKRKSVQMAKISEEKIIEVHEAKLRYFKDLAAAAAATKMNK